jgi:hypothetical protein
MADAHAAGACTADVAALRAPSFAHTRRNARAAPLQRTHNRKRMRCAVALPRLSMRAKLTRAASLPVTQATLTRWRTAKAAATRQLPRCVRCMRAHPPS